MSFGIMSLGLMSFGVMSLGLLSVYRERTVRYAEETGVQIINTSVHEVASGREKEVINGREREETSRKGAEDRKEKIEQKLKIMYRT